MAMMIHNRLAVPRSTRGDYSRAIMGGNKKLLRAFRVGWIECQSRAIDTNYVAVMVPATYRRTMLIDPVAGGVYYLTALLICAPLLKAIRLGSCLAALLYTSIATENRTRSRKLAICQVKSRWRWMHSIPSLSHRCL